MRYYSLLSLFSCVTTLACGTPSTKKSDLNAETKPGTATPRLVNVSDKPVSVVLQLDNLRTKTSDEILFVLDRINSKKPESERIRVSGLGTTSQNAMEAWEELQKKLKNAKTREQTMAIHGELKLVMPFVAPFLDLGLTLRSDSNRIPKLNFTKADHFDTRWASIWAQDYGEYGIDSNGESVFLYTGFFLQDAPNSSVLEKPFGAKLIDLKLEDKQEDYGGNIESLPNGLVLIGKNSSKELEMGLKNFGIKTENMLKLEEQLMESFHLDEQFTIIPQADECGFGIVKANPKAGKVLAQKFIESPEEFEGPEILRNYPLQGWNYELIEAMDFDQATVDSLTLMIDKNVEMIMQKSKEMNPKCQQLKVESIPVPIRHCEETGSKPKGCIVATGNPVNGVILGTDMITSDPMYRFLRKETTQAYQNLGITTHFVDATVLKANGGGVHCAMAVQRVLGSTSTGGQTPPFAKPGTATALNRVEGGAFLRKKPQQLKDLMPEEKCKMSAGKSIGFKRVISETEKFMEIEVNEFAPSTECSEWKTAFIFKENFQIK